MRKLILLWLLLPIQGLADSPVWKISNGENELFIGGTIHVLSRQDYPLPQAFERAYQLADKLVLETDLTAMEGLDVQQRLLQRVMYNDGRTIQDDLTPETYRKLVEYVSSIGLPMEALSRFKPPMLIITLTMAELQRLGMGDTGVDNYFNARALQDGKPLGELESVELQMDIIANMGKGHEDELVLNTLEELKILPELMGSMKAAWRSGDMRQMEEVAIVPMRNDYPGLYQSLLVERNNSWIPKIESLLATAEKEFILVGALHLAAGDGLIKQLIRKGYQVEQLN